MLRILLRFGALASIPLLSLVLFAAGCGRSQHRESSEATPAAALSAADSGCCGPHQAGHSAQAESAKPDNKTASGESEDLAKLPPQDRALAEKQGTCPVTDAPLGSMGVPCKVTLKGRTLFLCCPRCEEKLHKDPEKYLAKLSGKAPD